MSCASSCKTQDHGSYGECMRSKGLRVAYTNSAGGSDYTVQKRADKDLTLYAETRKQGIQPRTTRRVDVQAALDASDKTGKAFQA